MPAYYFPHREALTAALRLVNDPAGWNAPVERFALGLEDDEPAWLLQSAEPLAALTPARADVGDGHVQLDGERLPIRNRCEASRLMEAVPLAPGDHPDLSVVYVLVERPERFRALAQDCLMLDNDRLRYLPLGGGRVLLRIEGLSAFLMQRWQTEPGLAFYSPAPSEPRLLQPWGCRYPLPEKLSLVEAAEEVLFLLSDVAPWTVVRGRAEDIYERIVIDPGRLETIEVGVDQLLPEIPVALRLEPTERGEPARLWWLVDEHWPALERLITEASEDELHGLQIARLGGGGDDQFVIVARPGSSLAPAPSLLGAPAWAARLPDEHLYVPVGQRLAPLLSRRSLIEAMGLADDRLTIVTQRGGDRLVVQQVKRALLRPLASLADYRIERAKEPIGALLAAVTFDFDLTAETPDEPEPADSPTGKPGLLEAFRKWLRG